MGVKKNYGYAKELLVYKMKKEYYQWWFNLIIKRLNENALDEVGDKIKTKWKDDEYIQWFIKPILEAGLKEEKRMKEEFSKKEYCIKCNNWFKNKKERNSHICDPKDY